MKLLLVEDEEMLSKSVAKGLRMMGYAVDCAYDGEEALYYYGLNKYDLMILDLNLPKVDGMEVLRHIRQRDENFRILILSARNSLEDKISGLDSGSNDYLTKPFLPLELAVRVNALFRRAELSSDDKERKELPISCGNLCIIPNNRKTMIGGEIFKTTPTEYEFLFYLIQRQHSVVSKKELLKDIWGYHTDVDIDDTRVADDLVKRLRKKLRESGCTAMIETIWGYGYQMIEQ